MKKIISILLCLLMIVSIGSITAFADVDLNNNSSYSLGSNVSGCITENQDYYNYKFTLTSSGKIDLKFTGYLEKVDLYIYDANGEDMYSNRYNYWNENTRVLNINDTTYLNKGTYYFSIEKDQYLGNYSFKLDFTSSNESFEETLTTNNDSLVSASSLLLNTTYKGVITVNDDRDDYKFTLSSSGKIDLSFTGYLEKVDLYIYDANGEDMYSNRYNYWNENTRVLNINDTTYLNKGTYYLSIEKDEHLGNYSFKLDFTSSNESFEETLTTNNDSLVSASSISLNTTYKGVITANDERDNYKFTLSSSKKIYLNFTGYLEYVDLYIYNSNGEDVYSDKYSKWNENTKKITIKGETALSAGTYYFSIVKDESIGNYSFSINTYKEAPKKTVVKSTKVTVKTPSMKLTAGKRSFKVKYTKAKNAVGFQIKYKTGKGKWVTKTFVTSKSVTKVIKGLKKGKYKVQIRAFAKTSSGYTYSKWSKAKTVKVK